MPQTTERYPLTPMQQGMLYQHLAAPESGINIEQIVGTLNEPVDAARLRASWEWIVRRHDRFRASFAQEGLEESVQQVHETAVLPWLDLDWSNLAADERTARLSEFLHQDRRQGFQPDRAPLMRVALIRFAERDWRLVWTFHHLLIDGRSFPIVLREAFGRYDATDQALEPPQPKSFREYVEWLALRDPHDSESYWRAKLAGFTRPTPLPGLRRKPDPQGSGKVLEREARLTAETTAALRQSAERLATTPNTLVQAAWALTLSHFSGEEEVLFGAVRAGRRSSIPGAAEMVGVFLNTLPVRVGLSPTDGLTDWLQALYADQREVRHHERTPLMRILEWSDIPAGSPLFESVLIFDNFELSELLRQQGGPWHQRSFRLYERTGLPLSLYGDGGEELRFRLAVDIDRFESDPGQRLLDHFVMMLDAMAHRSEGTLAELPTLAPRDARWVLNEWNATTADYDAASCVHQLIERQVEHTPDAVALICGNETLTYAALNARANQLARHLQTLGIGPDRLVGVFVERSPDMLVGILGVLKAGGAYVPLDPAFPAERIAFMIEDAGLSAILTQRHLSAELPGGGPPTIALDSEWERIAAQPTTNVDSGVAPAHLAYVIYTSGSTGKPKGVMVEHRNVVNFFTGMDALVARGDPPQDVWLAVTSLSFDISVLELFWTLARGFRIVLYVEPQRVLRQTRATRPDAMRFSLFYFASDEAERTADKYRLLLEGTRFADRNDFVAVSTPERHFHAFGGLYPNPAVSAAALATITRNVQIRAGSVVLPLHHPIRVAEEWALVDNLSGGRVGISFASGWQPVDFVLRPENYAERNKLMYEGIEIVRKLWRGAAVEFPGPDGQPRPIRTLPRPVQAELPVWITTAGHPETWKSAGLIGANVLTHLLGQTVAEVGDKIRLYREARREAGHAGPGQVTIMLHTFVGDDIEQVRETVRRPMIEYLRSSLGLVKNVASAWTAFKRRADGSTASADIDLNALSDEEMDDLLAFSFERYFETSALFGTPRSCMAMVDALKAAGVDEIACLIDFGVGTDAALAHLEHLNQLRKLAAGAPADGSGEIASVGDLIRRHGVTHLQCTPSMANLILLDEESRDALAEVRVLLIGGEAFPGRLATQLKNVTDAAIINMYGPTETTIWSTAQPLDAISDTIPIGRPIANTTIYLLDPYQRPAPVGAVGELYIGGVGVTRGYHRRPELTAERFVPDPFADSPTARLYRTGDLARYRSDGVIEFLGRVDHQVKLLGHRIELGEIEATLARHPDVREAVVIAREIEPGDTRLVAYVIARGGRAIPIDELRRIVRDTLPDYMAPAHYLTLDAFPQTPNRKIDRKALPDPLVAARGTTGQPAATPTSPASLAADGSQFMSLDEIERTILQIWSDTLGLADIGLNDNFFDLGGHSLLAVKVHRQLKDIFTRHKLVITDLFRFPTIKALSAHLGADSESATDAGLRQSQDRAATRRSMMRQRRGGERPHPSPGEDHGGVE